MRKCRTCGQKFELSVEIDGKTVSLRNRMNCLSCFPYKSGAFGKHLISLKTRPISCDEKLREAVSSSTCLKVALAKLGLSGEGSYYYEIRKRIKELSLDTSHFLTRSGLSKGKSYSKRDLSEILIEHSPNKCNHWLKLRLIKEGYFEHKCYCCNLREWNDKPIPIQLEHKNGVRDDNRIENLTILCPNCHAQTDTYCGKNNKREQKYSSCKLCEGKAKLTSIYCLECKKNKPTIVYQRKNRRNVESIGRLNSDIAPPKDVLKKLLWEMPSTHIAEKLGVSGKAVAKWAKRYELSKPGRDYWAKVRYGKIQPIVG